MSLMVNSERTSARVYRATVIVFPANSTRFVAVDPATRTSNGRGEGGSMREPGARDSVRRRVAFSHRMTMRMKAPLR